MNKDDIDLIKKFLRFTSIPFEFFVTIGGGAWLGSWLDKKWHTGHLMLIICAVIGFFFGLYYVIKELKK